MKAWPAWTVFAKEWVDALRDRRTLAVVLLSSVLMGPLVLIALSGLVASFESRAERREVVLDGIENAPTLVNYLQRQGFAVKPAPEGFEEKLRRSELGDPVLVVPKDFEAALRHAEVPVLVLVSDSANKRSEAGSGRLQRLVAGFNRERATLALALRGVSGELLEPVRLGEKDLANPQTRGTQITGMLPFFVLMAVLYGALHAALDTTAGERERQSLEPLLATPAPRSALVGGKMLAAVLLGLLSMLLILVSFKTSASLASGGIGSQMDVSFAAMGKLLLTLLPLVLIGTALITALAAGAKSMKEAQSHIMWLMMLPMLPAYGLMAYPLKDTALWQYAVPFLSQNQLIQKITRGEVASFQQWAVYLGCSLALAAVLWALAVWRYKQEKLAISA